LKKEIIKLVSSANKLTLNSDANDKSFMYKINSNGPSVDP